MTISILISISIFVKSVDISTIDMSYRYIEQGYEHVSRKTDAVTVQNKYKSFLLPVGTSFRTSIETSMSGDLMAELTEAQLFELRDAFKLYEEQSEAGKVDLQELGRLLR